MPSKLRSLLDLSFGTESLHFLVKMGCIESPVPVYCLEFRVTASEGKCGSKEWTLDYTSQNSSGRRLSE